MKSSQHLVIITGHSSGLGRALLDQCLQDEVHVLGIARRRVDVLHPHLKQIQVDLSSAEPTIEQWLQPLATFLDAAAFEAVTLVHNAGTFQPIGFIGQLDAAAITTSLHANLTMPLQLSNWLLQKFPTQSLRIVHISSGAAHKIYAGWGIYGSSKAGLRMAAQVMAAEAEASGRDLRVLVYEPGVLDTPMQTELRSTPADRFPQIERFRQLHQSGQLVKASDSARALWELILRKDLPGYWETRFGERR